MTITGIIRSGELGKYFIYFLTSSKVCKLSYTNCLTHLERVVNEERECIYIFFFYLVST